MNTLFWEKVEAGRYWRVRRMLTGPTLGFVRFSFNAWDAYICTGKKWPNAEVCVNPSRHDGRFWSARRAVEYTIETRKNLARANSADAAEKQDAR